MKIQIVFKPYIILTLLLIVIVINTPFFSIFTRIDRIVNSDIYKFGLQFNHEWAEQYWTYSWMIISSNIIAILLIGISIVSFLIFAQTQNNSSRYACYLLLIIATALSILSALLVTRLDYIVNHDLYLFGLQFSYEWATNYWTYINLLFLLFGLSNTTILISIFLILFSARKKVIISPIKLTCLILMAVGVITLFLSIVNNPLILAFISTTFPLSFQDISLLLAIMALILLITSELLSPYYSKISINRKNLRNMAIIISVLFLITVAIRFYEIIAG